MKMFLPLMYAVLPSRSSVILFDSQNSLLQIAMSVALKWVSTTLDVTFVSFLTVKSNNFFAGSSHLLTVSMMYPSSYSVVLG
jgi:hypothetical protein